jgi:hypothetical protein
MGEGFLGIEKILRANCHARSAQQVHKVGKVACDDGEGR